MTMVSLPPRDPKEKALSDEIWNLGKVADERAIDRLLDHVEHGPSSVVFAAEVAVLAIAGRVPAAAPRLLAACERPALVACVALKALATVRHPAAVKLFRAHVGRLKTAGVPDRAMLGLLDTLDDPTMLPLVLEHVVHPTDEYALWDVHKLLHRWLDARESAFSDADLAELCRLADFVGPEWRPRPPTPPPGAPLPMAPRRLMPGESRRDWHVEFGDVRAAAAAALRARGGIPPEAPSEPRRVG
jgi:hypothetical protein